MNRKDLFAPITKEELDEVSQSNDLFAPITPEELTMVNEIAAPGRGESALRGALQGATFGFSDEIGALPALLPGGDSYRERLKQIRQSDNASSEENPVSYNTGLVGGSLATMAIPGLGALNAAKGASLATRAGLSAAGGALAGLGESDKSSVTEALQDTAIGGALGGVLQAGGEKVLAPIAKSSPGKFVLKKAGKYVANVPEEFSERYLNRTHKIQDQVPGMDEIADNFLDPDAGQMKLLREKISELDAEAWSKLSREPEIRKQDLLEGGEEMIRELTSGKKGTLSRSEPVGKSLLQASEIQKQLTAIKNSHGEILSEHDLKGIIQDMQGLAYTLDGPKTSPQAEAIRNLSGMFNDALKTRNKNYKTAMIPVERAVGTAKRTQKLFTNRSDISDPTRFMNSAEKVGNPRKKLVNETIEESDRLTGSSYQNDILDRRVLNSFDKPDVQGSRKTVAGGMIGAALGEFFMPGGGGLPSAALGAMTGGLADRDGGRVFKAILDGRINIIKAGQWLGSNAAAKALGKYSRPLRQAAQRGPKALATTHFLLQQRDPEYRQLVNQKDDKE